MKENKTATEGNPEEILIGGK